MQDVVTEVRAQFSERPGIMDGTQKPDYARCVAIVTKAALSEMRKPGALALLFPIAVGFCFRFLGSLQVYFAEMIAEIARSHPRHSVHVSTHYRAGRSLARASMRAY